MRKESKYIYIKLQCDGWYKITNNGEVVAEDLNRIEAEKMAEEMAKVQGKKVKNDVRYDW